MSARPCPYGACRYACLPGTCRGQEADAPPIIPTRGPIEIVDLCAGPFGVCEREARFRVRYRGDEMLLCELCKTRGAQLAEALGLPFEMQAIKKPERPS